MQQKQLNLITLQQKEQTQKLQLTIILIVIHSFGYWNFLILFALFFIPNISTNTSNEILETSWGLRKEEEFGQNSWKINLSDRNQLYQLGFS